MQSLRRVVFLLAAAGFLVAAASSSLWAGFAIPPAAGASATLTRPVAPDESPFDKSPEAASLLLVGSGLLSLAYAGRRLRSRD
jgi:hypothetical protein